MAPQTRITVTNLIGIAAIVVTIGGSATLLYSAVISNQSRQEEINKNLKSDISNVKQQEASNSSILIQTRESQIRMEEQLKELLSNNQRYSHAKSK